MRCAQTYYKTLPFTDRCRGILQSHPATSAGKDWEASMESEVRMFVSRLFIDIVNNSVYIDLLPTNYKGR